MILSPEEKAKKLIAIYAGNIGSYENEVVMLLAKTCAIIAVDEIIEALKKLRKPEYALFIEWEQLKERHEADILDGYEYSEYYEQVKTHLQNL